MSDFRSSHRTQNDLLDCVVGVVNGGCVFEFPNSDIQIRHVGEVLDYLQGMGLKQCTIKGFSVSDSAVEFCLVIGQIGYAITLAVIEDDSDSFFLDGELDWLKRKLPKTDVNRGGFSPWFD